jgi:hypothetical protein
MSDLDDREKAFENKYALDQELTFRIEARAVKLFGLWIAEKLDMSADAAKDFAGNVVAANLDEPGFDDVKRAVLPALAEKGIEISDHVIDTQLARFMEEARVQIMNEPK